MLKDTTREVEEMQNRLWMERTTLERAKFMFGMFATARRILISSLPKTLTEKELKSQIYQRTYGELLPADFFSAKKNDI